MGTATYASTKRGVAGNLRIEVGNVTMSNSYAAGGDTLAASAFGLQEIFYADIKGLPSRIALEYDITNSKVLAYFPTGGSPTAPTTLADPVGATGGTAVTSSAATLPLVPGRGKEVAATADLSAVVGRILVIGV